MKKMNLLESLILVLICGLSGLLMSFAFPMRSFFLLAFVSFVPMFILIYQSSVKQILIGFAAYGFVFFGSLLYWTSAWLLSGGELPAGVGLLGLFLMLFVLAVLYYGTTALVASFVSSRFPKLRAFIAPAIFTLLAYLRTVGFLGFPWGIIGYSQWNNLAFIQTADIVGVLGVSFLVYFTNGVIAELFLGWQASKFKKLNLNVHSFSLSLLLVVLITLSLVYGKIKLDKAKRENKEGVDITLVQKNFDPNLRWQELYKGGPAGDKFAIGPFVLMDPSKLTPPETAVGNLKNGTIATARVVRLMREAALDTPSLIVLPESAMMDFYKYYLPLAKRMEKETAMGNSISDSTKERGGPYNAFLFYMGVKSISNYVLTGSSEYIKLPQMKPKYYNAAFLIDKDGEVLTTHAKMKPVPFGEAYPFSDSVFMKTTVPFSYFVSLINNILSSSGAGEWDTWDTHTVYEHPEMGYTFSVLICYDNAFGDFVREFSLKGASMLFNLTDDAWSYSDTSQMEHFTISVFRAIENRRDLLRAANAGVTGHIDAYGRVIKTLPMWEADTLAVKPVPREGITIYVRYGEWFVGLLTIIILTLLSIYYGKHLFLSFKKLK